MEKQIGYSAARSEQIVAFAFALGREDRVAQVGCDVQRVHLSKHIPIGTYIESISHKVRTIFLCKFMPTHLLLESKILPFLSSATQNSDP